jgi:prevent-host-death family protein
MQTFNLHAAKTHFSRLVDEAAAGEEIIIAKAGKPVAKLAPLNPTVKARRRLGMLKRHGGSLRRVRRALAR